MVNRVMKNILLFVVFLLASSQASSSEDVLLKYAYNFPLLICYSDEYRACYENIDIENCALELKRYRDPCLAKANKSKGVNAISGLAACMVASHAGKESIEEISDPCIKEKGMNINISKNFKKIVAADPKWVKEVLE